MISSLKLHEWSDNQIKCVRCAPRKYDLRQSEYQQCYQHGEVCPDPERIQALKEVDKANGSRKAQDISRYSAYSQNAVVALWAICCSVNRRTDKN